MDETELEKQRHMVTRSSIRRKPLTNLTNIIRKPYSSLLISQSKSPRSSTASDSSIGSTQNPIHENHPLIVSPDQPLPSTPPSLTPAHLVGDESVNAQRRTTRKTLNNVKADFPFHQTSAKETRNKSKEGSRSICSSTLEKIKDKRKALDGSYSGHHVKNANNIMDTPISHSTMKMKDKGKENDVQSSYLHSGNANINLADSLLKRKDKGKSIDVPQDYPPMKTRMLEVLAPSSGVIIKDKGKKVVGSSHVDLPQNDVQSSYPHLGNTNINLAQSLLKRKDKGKSIVVPQDYPSMETRLLEVLAPSSGVVIKDKGKKVVGSSYVDLPQNDVQSSYPHSGNTNINLAQSLLKRNNKGKSIAVPEDYSSMNTRMLEVLFPSSGVIIKDKGKKVVGSSHVDLPQNDVESSYPHSGNTIINLAQSLLKRKDKGKSIAVPEDYTSMNTRMLEVLAPSSGVIIKDKGKKIMGSSHVDLFQKDEGNVVVTPIYNRALKKKDKESSCPPLLRTTSNRNQDDGAEDIFQSKLQTEPPPNKKKKRCFSMDSVEEYTLPQDFVEQQRAYFKEIDDFELEVEEV